MINDLESLRFELEIEADIVLFPFEVMTMKLDVILPVALPDRSPIFATLKDGKYFPETRF